MIFMNYLFIILSFLLSFNVWSGQENYPPAIRMPNLKKELSVQSVRISAMAIEQWKTQLRKALSKIALSPQVSIKERLQELISKQRDFFEEKAKIDSLREKSNKALQDVWGSRFDEELKTSFKGRKFRNKEPQERAKIALTAIKKMLSQPNIDLELKGPLEALLQKDIEDIQAEVLGLEFHPLFINFFRSTIYKTDSVPQKLILLEKELKYY